MVNTKNILTATAIAITLASSAQAYNAKADVDAAKCLTVLANSADPSFMVYHLNTYITGSFAQHDAELKATLENFRDTVNDKKLASSLTERLQDCINTARKGDRAISDKNVHTIAALGALQEALEGKAWASKTAATGAGSAADNGLNADDLAGDE